MIKTNMLIYFEKESLKIKKYLIYNNKKDYTIKELEYAIITPDVYKHLRSLERTDGNVYFKEKPKDNKQIISDKNLFISKQIKPDSDYINPVELLKKMIIQLQTENKKMNKTIEQLNTSTEIMNKKIQQLEENGSLQIGEFK